MKEGQKTVNAGAGDIDIVTLVGTDTDKWYSGPCLELTGGGVYRRALLTRIHERHGIRCEYEYESDDNDESAGDETDVTAGFVQVGGARGLLLLVVVASSHTGTPTMQRFSIRWSFPNSRAGRANIRMTTRLPSSFGSRSRRTPVWPRRRPWTCGRETRRGLWIGRFRWVQCRRKGFL